MRWNDDAGLDAIAAELGRSQLEVTLLVIEQAELGLIEQQRQGIYGNKKVSIKTPYFIEKTDEILDS